MKKNIMLVGVFISLFMIFKSDVFAYTTSGESCALKGTCLLLCNYTNKTTGGTSLKAYPNYSGPYDYEYVSIYYDFNTDSFGVGWWNGNSGEGNKKFKGFGNANQIFSTNGQNVFIDKTPTNAEFTCPTNGYSDLSTTMGNNEVCFDSDGKYCENSSNMGTKFGKKSDTFVSTKRDMTFEDELQNYFSDFSLRDITIEDFISGKYTGVSDFQNELITSIRENYLHGNEMPQFMKNSDTYQSGTALLRKNFDSMKSTWLNELEEKKNSGEISESKYNEVLNNINKTDDEFDDVVKDTLDNIDTVNKTQDSLVVTPVDVCSQDSGSLKAFQIVGYIILIIKILVPLILIVMGSIDFAKAAISSDADSSQKAAVKLGMRILTGLVVFFIPTALDFFLSLVSGVSETMSKYQNCTSCVLSPNNTSRCNPKGLSSK